MKRIIILLIVVALLVGIVGCVDIIAYTLTITSAPGGSVTTPGEGRFFYTSRGGTVVNLVATPDIGYRFINWTGDVGTVANVTVAATTITMNGDYSIIANFETLFAGGNGTEEYPYQIVNWNHLYNVRYCLDNYFILMNDLDSTTTGYEELASSIANGGKGWQPIGYGNWDGYQWVGEMFVGALDGQGYEIRDLFINRGDEYDVGLFGFVGEGGVVEDVGVIDIVVSGYAETGGLVGENYLCTVSNSYSTGSVTAKGNGVGGLVGRNNEGSVDTSYSTCDVAAVVGVGGLVGIINGGLVSNSYCTGNISGNEEIGGLGGCNGGTISNSYSTGSVTGLYTIGGLVGHNYRTVSNSYSTANVTGYAKVGGLMGMVDGGTVSNCYSTGNVSGSEETGGLVGSNYTNVTNSFWDIETSGQGTSAGGTGKTTAEMKNIATFSSAGWNITAVANPSTRNTSYVWNIVNNVTYPFLSWEP